MPARHSAKARLVRELYGRAALNSQPMSVQFGRSITSVRRRRSAPSEFILPGFIDLQINGAYGVDVMSANAEDLLRLSNALAREGTTAWLPTVITSPIDTIERCDEVIAAAMELQQEIERTSKSSTESIGAKILGMHLEGPFISPRRLGAHPPLNLPPEGDFLERVLALKTLKLITLAPELDDALNAIRRLVAREVTVSIGHTDANYEQALAGLDAGATMFTHLFNAMPPFHHRAPGPIGAAAGNHRTAVMMIPDGVHVHPAAVRLCCCLRLIFVTDRLAFADAKKAPVSLFNRPCVGAFQDGRVIRMADGTLAGSTITMLEGAQTMFRELHCDLAIIEKATSANAAEALHLSDRGKITTRACGDLIVLDRDLNLKAVFIAGRELK